MSAPAEYIPDATEQTAVASIEPRTSTGQILKLTSEAYQFAAVDQRLSHGAVRLFVLLVERSWWYNWGGDGRGGITISIGKLAKKIRAKRHSVILWLSQLVRSGYIWCDKIPQRSGWPASKYFVSCLVPRSDQRELLPSVPLGTSAGAHTGTWTGAQTDTTQGAQNGTSPSAQTGTLMEGTGKKGRGGPADQFPDARNPYLRWLPTRVESELDRLAQEERKFRADDANYKKELARETAGAIDWLKAEALKAQKAGDKKTAKKHLAEAERRQKNPENYVRGSLTETAAAKQANFSRKRQWMEEALNRQDAA